MAASINSRSPVRSTKPVHPSVDAAVTAGALSREARADGPVQSFAGERSPELPQAYSTPASMLALPPPRSNTQAATSLGDSYGTPQVFGGARVRRVPRSGLRERHAVTSARVASHTLWCRLRVRETPMQPGSREGGGRAPRGRATRRACRARRCDPARAPRWCRRCVWCSGDGPR